jgi:hypothetical protein
MRREIATSRRVAAAMIGESETDALFAARGEGRQVEVVRRDGVGPAFLTSDGRPKRIRVEIVNSIVTKASAG